jgi:2'-5' RNA ligase
MGCCNGGETRINSFALVSYLADPLAVFLDRLRTDLVPGCHAKAHVTVLPPRPLSGPADEAWSEIEKRLQDVPPFRVELADIEVFPATQVIYLSVKDGGTELRRLHRMLNTGSCAFEEPFSYHPHLTIAQDLELSQLDAAIETTRERWRQFPGRRGFVVEKLTFVQNTMENRWSDLNLYPLKPRIHADAR